jgi:hypothetical protein
LSKGGLAVSRKRKLGDSASKKRPKGNWQNYRDSTS